MEDDEAQENLSQWEQVSSVSSHSNLSWDMEPLQLGDHFPSHHDEASSTPLPPQNIETESPPSSSSSSPTPPPESPNPAPSTSSSTNVKGSGGTEAQRRPSCGGSSAAREIAARLMLQLRVLSAEARRVFSRALVARGFLSAVSGAVAAFLISLLYRRWRRRRRALAPRDHDKERLVLLLREKDEKIGQLMIRIAELNEALSARRRVPVIRVG